MIFLFALTLLSLPLGISLVDESVTPSGARTEVAPGIHAAYDLPNEVAEIETCESVDASISLEELMAQMKSM